MYPTEWRMFSGHSMMIRARRSLQIPRSLGMHFQHQVFRHTSVPLNVYSDRFGLEYWLHEKDSE